MDDNLNLISYLLTFIIGGVTGYLLHDFLKKTLQIGEESSKNFVLFAVTIIWTLSMLASILNPDYQTPLAVHGILGGIAGYFFWKPNGGDR